MIDYLRNSPAYNLFLLFALRFYFGDKSGNAPNHSLYRI